MKKSKKAILIILGVVVPALAAGILWVGLQVVPTVNHALRISELLQPVIAAENQRLRLAASAEFDGRVVELESDVYLVTEGGASYLALEQAIPKMSGCR